MTDQKKEVAISRLRGNADYFRECLQAEAILGRVCLYAEIEAERQRCEPWSIIGRITGHGSGVSSAIYEVYRK
jgi:hypothetical protein